MQGWQRPAVRTAPVGGIGAIEPRHADPSKRFHLPLGVARTRGAYNNVGSREAAFGRIEFTDLLSKIRHNATSGGKSGGKHAPEGRYSALPEHDAGVCSCVRETGGQARTQWRLAQEEAVLAMRRAQRSLHSPQPTPKEVP